MFGHSHGAEATAETMLQDHRITAGAELDGGVSTRVAAAGLHTPFMVISGNSPASPKTEENLTTLWPHLTGWNRWLRLRDSGHLTFTDFETFAPELDTPPAIRQNQFGTLDPERAVPIEQTYLLAFFNQSLDHHHQRLLDRPSTRYPEMVFER
jgi:hypothetical protein